MNQARAEIRQRIQRAFEQGHAATYVVDFLKDVRDNWCQAEDKVRRSALFIVFLAAAFELFRSNAISEPDIGFFKISNVDIVYKILPVTLSYFYYDLMALLVFRTRLRIVHEEIIAHIYKTVHNQRLHLYLQPISTLFNNNLQFVPEGSGLRKAVDGYERLLGTFIVLGTPIFLGYAFYQLRSSLLAYDPLTGFALTASALLVCRGLLTLATSRYE